VTKALEPILALALVILLGAPVRAAEPKLETEDEKTIYALGLALSQNLGQFNLSPQEVELVKAGLADGVLGKEKRVDLQIFGPKINQFAKTRAAAAAIGEKKSSEAYLAKAAGEKGAK
jgi:FKBP-type peptidyl-prolyl cis-trans isomerase FkpA